MENKVFGIRHCPQLGLALLMTPELKLRPPKHPNFIILSSRNTTTTMSARTTTTVRLLHQPHRLGCRILRPIRYQSPSSFSTFPPTWSRPILPLSSRLPSSLDRHYSSVPTLDTPRQPIFAENVNPEELSVPLQSLLDEKQWSLDDEGKGVAKTYHFKTYTKCLVRSLSLIVLFSRSIMFLVTNISALVIVPGLDASGRNLQQIEESSSDYHRCRFPFHLFAIEAKNALLIMSLGEQKAGSVHIHWTTHFPRGITQKDIDMAQYCDQQAALIGTVQQSDANKCRPLS